MEAGDVLARQRKIFFVQRFVSLQVKKKYAWLNNKLSLMQKEIMQTNTTGRIYLEQVNK